MDLPLNPDDDLIAEDYLDSLINAFRHRGKRLWENNAVRDLKLSSDGQSVIANVKGGALYKVSFIFSGSFEEWEGDCTCPVGTDCKHCAAAMFEILDSLRNNRQLPKANENAKKVAKPKQKGGKAREKQAPSNSFLAILNARLGRLPTKAEIVAAERVDFLFQRHRDSRMLNEQLFEPIKIEGGKWAWTAHEVWPSPPENVWQTWLYIVGLARRLGWKLIPGLLEITDSKEVDGLMAIAERANKVKYWRDWLKTTSQKLDGTSIRQAEMRARLGLKGIQLEWRKEGTTEFKELKAAAFNEFLWGSPLPSMDTLSLCVWKLFTASPSSAFQKLKSVEAKGILGPLLRLEAYQEKLVNPDGEPFQRSEANLQWQMQEPESHNGDYRFQLVLPDGSSPPKALVVLDGSPSFYVTKDTIFKGPATIPGLVVESGPAEIPAEVLETGYGLNFLDRLQLPPPERIASKIRSIRPRLILRGWIKPDFMGHELLHMSFRAEAEPGQINAKYLDGHWVANNESAYHSNNADSLIRWDRSAMEMAPRLTEIFEIYWNMHTLDWSRRITKNFPEQFAQSLGRLPEVDGIELELDPLIASLRNEPITARVSLDVQEVSIDWFDLKVSLSVSDTTLSEEEIRRLLDAKGGFVRLGTKGWQRLQYQLDEEEEKQLADIGMTARDFTSEPQRLHALQLAGKKAAARLLPGEQATLIARRVEEIRTRVTPDLPAGLQATLRPYQVEGFHFLAYLTENNFGGILADDMGLGKTIQTLAWLLWLRARAEGACHPSLVVCPKSVTENWASEVTRFAPELSFHVLERGGCDLATFQAIREKAALVVVNYSQLRLVEGITELPWQAVILDEAQYIKNPQSQTAQAANALKASQRIALSGTPIENRLLDLWSILGFAMPGILGNRASFTRDFDQKTDPLSRRRLAARVRPFVLRRTKTEVAKDLPERIEEDLHCEMEGDQAKLYTAELKRARAALLKIKTGKELDKLRFNVLTSLLRLRQICCHPALVDAKATKSESAKLNALLDLLEPLVEEGQKVLVFSQFVQMLSLIKEEVAKRKWRHLVLTGETENRGDMVKEFQATEGSSIFLISLRAGGFGLNLTAASYVVLFDPWWNPAVEAQAIDRTHRIGQTNTVIAYRLLVKTSIEEKIRTLQTSKRALSEDILGEENFTRTLSLDDFRFLLE